MSASINKRIAVGAGWMVSLRWVDRFIGLVSIAILARLLLPIDFGLLGYAMVFLGTLDQLAMFNFQLVLIRDQDAPEERYSTAWTLEIIKGIILAAIMIAGAGAAADFFGEPKVEGILYWIAVVPIVRGLVNIGIVDFQKNMELHKVFLFERHSSGCWNDYDYYPCLFAAKLLGAGIWPNSAGSIATRSKLRNE